MSVIDTKVLQKQVIANKLAHGWEVNDMAAELLAAYGELAELTQGYWRADHDNIAEELADVTIYLLGMAEMQNIDLGAAVVNKIAINARRRYDDQGHKQLMSRSNLAEQSQGKHHHDDADQDH